MRYNVWDFQQFLDGFLIRMYEVFYEILTEKNNVTNSESLFSIKHYDLF